MKNTSIIEFRGMEFKRESHPSTRLRKKSRQMRRGKDGNQVATNVRTIFSELFGF